MARVAAFGRLIQVRHEKLVLPQNARRLVTVAVDHILDKDVVVAAHRHRHRRCLGRPNAQMMQKKVTGYQSKFEGKGAREFAVEAASRGMLLRENFGCTPPRR